MYALSSKSGSEPFRFALFWGDLRWNDPKWKVVPARNSGWKKKSTYMNHNLPGGV